MSLNPIAFGEHVVEQFQRYLLTYFPIADRRMEGQVRDHLSRGPGGRRELVRGPYIHLNRPFEPGPMLADLLAESELDLHPALPGLFSFEQLYKLHDEPMVFGHPIAPNPAQPPRGGAEEDSIPERDFLDLLDDRNFPLPEQKQYAVQLPDGSLTAADFAWPKERVLIYIDGMAWHGHPEVQRTDHITRIKLRSAGYKVVEMTAQELGDAAAINRVLEELAVYLGRDDLLGA